MNKEEKQKEFITNLQNEVNKLEDELENIDKTNRKRVVIKNVKIFGKKIQKVAPYFVLALALSIPYFNFVGVPFVNQPVKASAYIQETQCSNGEIDTIKQYIEFSNMTHYVEIYSPWEQTDTGYTRSRKTYVLDVDTVNRILDVTNGTLIGNVESILGLPNDITTQTSNHVTEEELAEPGFVKLVTYSKDNNDTIVRMRTSNEIMGISCVYILGLLVIEMVVYFTSDKRNERCNRKINEYKETYKTIDSEEIRKELLLKKDNLMRLTNE